MKVKTLALVAGLSAPLILTSSPDAGFVGLKVVSKPSINPNRLICNIYAQFDRPGEDRLNIVGGTVLYPLQIDVISGKFFNPAAGGDLAPSPQQIADNPNLAEDSFVTIGVKVYNPTDPGNGGQPTNNTSFKPGWPGFGTNTLSTTGSAWFVTPNDPQGDPFNPAYVAGNGQILIAQFTVRDIDGDGFVALSGSMLLQVVSNGQTIDVPVSFFCSPPCPWDCQVIPDGFVSINDLFQLLAQWNQVGTSCDFDGGGAGITDLFEMFGNWGQCP